MVVVGFILATSAVLLLFVMFAANLLGPDVLLTFHEERASKIRYLKRYLATHLLRAFLSGLPLIPYGSYVLLEEQTMSRPSWDIQWWFFCLFTIWWLSLMPGLAILAWEFLRILRHGNQAP